MTVLSSWRAETWTRDPERASCTSSRPNGEAEPVRRATPFQLNERSFSGVDATFVSLAADQSR